MEGILKIIALFFTFGLFPSMFTQFILFAAALHWPRMHIDISKALTQAQELCWWSSFGVGRCDHLRWWGFWKGNHAPQNAFQVSEISRIKMIKVGKFWCLWALHFVFCLCVCMCQCMCLYCMCLNVRMAVNGYIVTWWSLLAHYSAIPSRNTFHWRFLLLQRGKPPTLVTNGTIPCKLDGCPLTPGNDAVDEFLQDSCWTSWRFKLFRDVKQGLKRQKKGEINQGKVQFPTNFPTLFEHDHLRETPNPSSKDLVSLLDSIWLLERGYSQDPVRRNTNVTNEDFSSTCCLLFWGWHVVPILSAILCNLWYVCLLTECIRIGYKKAKSQAGATLLRSSVLGRVFFPPPASEIDGAPLGHWPVDVAYTHSLKTSRVCLKGFGIRVGNESSQQMET